MLQFCGQQAEHIVHVGRNLRLSSPCPCRIHKGRFKERGSQKDFTGFEEPYCPNAVTMCRLNWEVRHRTLDDDLLHSSRR